MPGKLDTYFIDPNEWDRIKQCECGSNHCTRAAAGPGMWYEGSGYESYEQAAFVSNTVKLALWLAWEENTDPQEYIERELKKRSESVTTTQDLC